MRRAIVPHPFYSIRGCRTTMWTDAQADGPGATTPCPRTESFLDSLEGLL